MHSIALVLICAMNQMNDCVQQVDIYGMDK